MWNIDIVRREHEEKTLLLDDVTDGYLSIKNHTEVGWVNDFVSVLSFM